ncbi:MAG: sensor domain-containing diguanylate cyclase [Actinobacteria bacterium]|nr:sensor domain-containing diguanylate cyclase [Actinomycetota bacterium]MBV8562741.1 sensor domain-containing diguanylate cyclase [Actinomycetota bacterium]
MNSLLIAISAALGVCVVLLTALAVVLSRRSGQRSDERVETVVTALEARMDELAHELASAVERAEEEGRRSRFLSQIAGTIDLDDVLARTLEGAAALPGADAALIRLDGAEKPVVATVGLSVEEAEGQAIAGPPDRREARAIELHYRYGDELAGQELIHGGLAVPLLSDAAGRFGYLSVFSRSASRRFDDEDVSRLEELADRAAPAIENARRFREARLLADLDALTGLHNRRYFHETLAREVARAHRYGRTLTLVILDLDDFKDINDRVGHLAGDAVLAEAAERVRGVVRSADVPCRIGGDEFAVIVPESGMGQGQLLVSRIQRAISDRPLGQAGRVRLSAGIAELQAEDDAVSLFERADSQLYAAKLNGKGGMSVAEPA